MTEDNKPDKYNLPMHMRGQFKNKDVQEKAQATKARNREEAKKRKEAAQTGFSLSHASDPHQQAALINRLWQWALGKDANEAKFAMKMLNDMGVTKQPNEKPAEEAPTVKKKDAKQAVDFLKQKSKEANE